MPDLRIAWLYPDQMNIYGDRGNILSLTRRCEWRGIDFEVVRIGPGDEIAPETADLLFVGGGQDREQRLVAEDLLTRKAEGLRAAVTEGLVILAVCGGYQLLGHEYRDADGTVLTGVSVLDLHTEPARPGEKRIIGNLVAEAVFPGAEGKPRLVGFENHGGRTILGAEASPLARVLRGGGNNGRDGFEGCVQGSVFGTYLHGSLLPKNPWLADLLLERALRRLEPGYTLTPLDDGAELAARDAAEQRAMTVSW
jgi:lipid II isoglutaminyl synthase (glutamine-hydrolysing)